MTDYLIDRDLTAAPAPHQDKYSFLLSSRIDGWSDAIATAREARLDWAGSIVRRTDSVNAAVRLIVEQFTRDFVDLMDEVDRAAGRPAMRTARVLLEHAINLCTVLDDDEQSSRYIAHLELGPILAADAVPNAISGFVKGRDLRRVEHRMQAQARGARNSFKAALDLYGPAFRRSWSAKNLHDRAAEQGVLGMYDLYRLGSLTTHGSAGAAAHTSQTAGLSTVIHLGRDLRQAPIAFLMGLYAVSSVDGLLERSGLTADFAALRSATQPLFDRWSTYWWLLGRYEESQFRQAHDALPPTILAVSRTGATRWFVEDPRNSVWRRCLEPKLDEHTRVVVEEIIADLRSALGNDDLGARWIAVRMIHTEAPPLDQASPAIPDSAVELLPLATIAAWDAHTYPELLVELERLLAGGSPLSDLSIRDVLQRKLKSRLPRR